MNKEQQFLLSEIARLHVALFCYHVEHDIKLKEPRAPEDLIHETINERLPELRTRAADELRQRAEQFGVSLEGWQP